MDWKEWLRYEDGKLFWLKCTSRTGSGPNQPGKLAGCKDGPYGYAVLNFKGKMYAQHRIIWEMFNGPIPKGLTIDHIDRNKQNNLISNLRLADIYLQNANRDSNLINDPATGRFKRKS